MAMSEVDRFAEFYRMLGYELEDFQRLIVEECFSARRETLVLLPRANGRTPCSPGWRCGVAAAPALKRMRERRGSLIFSREADVLLCNGK